MLGDTPPPEPPVTLWFESAGDTVDVMSDLGRVAPDFAVELRSGHCPHRRVCASMSAAAEPCVLFNRRTIDALLHAECGFWQNESVDSVLALRIDHLAGPRPRDLAYLMLPVRWRYTGRNQVSSDAMVGVRLEVTATPSD